MPELPDVATFQGYVDATALHQPIMASHLRDPRVLGAGSAQALHRQLKGATLSATQRHGKWLFLSLDHGGALILHFGMTGFLRYTKGTEQAPEHNVFVIDFSNGYHLTFNDQRRLGRVGLVDTPEAFIAQRGLGPDALALDEPRFMALLDASRGGIKSLLMNQHRIAGLGNVYSDEILFQARIHPRTPVRTLRNTDRHRLYQALRSVLNETIACRAEPACFPGHYLTPQRGPDGVCPRCGNPLQRIQAAGRSSYLCPQRQRPPEA